MDATNNPDLDGGRDMRGANLSLQIYRELLDPELRMDVWAAVRAGGLHGVDGRVLANVLRLACAAGSTPGAYRVIAADAD